MTEDENVVLLTRLNGQPVAINPDLIAWIEIMPDTTVSLVGGDKLIVKESLDTVIDRIVQYRRATAGGPMPRASLVQGLRSGVSTRPSKAPHGHLRLSTVPPDTNEK